MNTLSSAPSMRPPQRLQPAAQVSIRVGIVAGLIPLALLLIGTAGMLLISMLALALSGSIAFSTRQVIMVVITACGLLVSVVLYAIACVYVLRLVKRWRHEGERNAASAGLWALVFTAVVVASPVVIAALAPYSGP